MGNGNGAGNGTSRWAIGIALSAALAVGGWGTTAVLATRNTMLGEVRDEVKTVRALADGTDRRVYTLEAQYQTIISTLGEIKDRLKDVGR